MAAIHFESSIDNSKLNKGIKESEQTVDEFVKHVEKSGGVIGDFSTQSAKDMKDSIAIQKQAIKELEQEIKKLQQTADNSTGQGKSNANKSLVAAKSDLAAEQQTLIDMQKAQVAGNAVEAESQIPIIAGLWKWALGLASVAAAMKIGKDILNSTEATAHQFEQGIAAADAATTYFFKTIASGDWSNFFSGISEAINAATEYVSKIEEINNLRNEQAGKNVEYDRDIAIAMSKTFDQDKKNQATVLENIQIVIDKTKQKHAENAVLNKQTYDAEAEQIAKKNGLEAEFVKDAVKAYSAHKAEFDLGEKYLASQKATEASMRTRGGGDLSGDVAFSNLAKYGIIGEKASKDFANWQKLTKEEKKLITDLYVSWEQEDAQSVIGPRRMEMRKATLNKQIEDDAKAAAKKAIEDAQIENRIKATQEAMKTANGQKLAGLAAGLVLLEKELALRKQIVDYANMSAWTDQFKGQSMAPMTSIGTKPIRAIGAIKITDGVLYELTAIDKKGHETFTKVGLENKKLFAYTTELAKEADKEQKDLDKEAEKRKKDNQKALIDGAYQLTNQFIDQLNLSKEQTKAMHDFADVAANAISGNMIEAGVGVISMVLGMLDISGKKQDEANQKAIENKKILTDYLNEMISLQVQYNIALNDQIQLQNGQSVFINDYVDQAQTASKKLMATQTDYMAFLDSLQKTNGFGYYGSLIGDTQKLTNALSYLLVPTPTATNTNKMDSLLSKYPELIDANGKFNAELAKTLLNINNLPDATKVALNGLIDYTDKLKEYQDAINSAIESIAGSISTNLFSALSNAWDAGTDSFTAFKDSVSKGLKDIAKQMLFNTLFAQDFITLQSDMAASFAVGGDGSIIDDIAKFYATGKDKATAWNAGMSAINTQLAGLGIDAGTISGVGSSSSLTGQIKGASEETVSMVAGRLMKINVDMDKGYTLGMDQLDVMTGSLGSLMKIEKNTFDTVQQIIATNTRLDTVISNQVKFG